MCEITYIQSRETIQMPINRELVKWLYVHIMESQVVNKKND